MTCASLFAQAPANAPDVMLQGFYWDSYQGGTYGNTNWSSLKNQVDEIAESFDLVWLPPSAKSSGGTGYHPKEWCNQTSAWGGATVLRELIKAFKDKGTRCVADIVINHRDGNNGWVDFCNEHFKLADGSTFVTKDGIKAQYDDFYSKSRQLICNNDECNKKGHTTSGNADAGAYAYCDEYGYGGDGFYCASRDLDHSNTYLQGVIKSYLQWMKEYMGYDGWRYDLVKGYLGKYTQTYNNAAGAYMSVGEYWSGDYNEVKGWINSTGNTSMAFDFPMKYAALNNALAGNNYAGLAGGYGVPHGLCGADEMKRYAVTFVDNHDTFRDHNKFGGDWTKANAYILSAPGIPCVFWPHWKECKNDIKAMIAARKKVGIHSQSKCTTEGTCGSYYKCTTTGTSGSLICFIGSGWQDPAGYTKACGGNGWAFYTKGGIPDGPKVTMSPAGGYVGENGTVTLTATKGTIYYTTDGTTPSASSSKYSNPIKITKNNTTIKAIAIDGDKKSSIVSGTFLTEKPAGLTVQFKAPSSWSTVYLHAWTATGNVFTEGWPGKKISKNGDYYTYTITETDERPISIIFNNGTQQTADIENVSANGCWDASSWSATDTKKIPGTCSGSPIPPVPPVPGTDITVQFTAPSDWSNVHIYAWTGTNNELFGTWPGKVATKNSLGQYMETFKDLSSVNVIFNSGSNQTVDLTATSNTCWDGSNNKGTDDKGHIQPGDCSYTAIDEAEAVELNIYPNPTNDYINIDCAEDINQVVIYSINGSEVIRTKSTYIDLSSLNPSMYFVNVMLQNGNVVRSKVIRK
jgi:alpha-amylase